MESQTETLWTQSQKSYEKNGIGRTSLKSHVANIVKQDALLDMIYGNGAARPWPTTSWPSGWSRTTCGPTT